jgi:hypothetical protein
VEEFTYKGVEYLRDENTGIVYDAASTEKVGLWNGTDIEFCEEWEEEE